MLEHDFFTVRAFLKFLYLILQLTDLLSDHRLGLVVVDLACPLLVHLFEFLNGKLVLQFTLKLGHLLLAALDVGADLRIDRVMMKLIFVQHAVVESFLLLKTHLHIFDLVQKLFYLVVTILLTQTIYDQYFHFEELRKKLHLRLLFGK